MWSRCAVPGRECRFLRRILQRAKTSAANERESKTGDYQFPVLVLILILIRVHSREFAAKILLHDPRPAIRPDRHLPLRPALREGFEVFGVDSNPQAVESVRRLAASLAPALPKENFRAESLDQSSFQEAFADVVISSAVLHFARDDDDFNSMLRGSWRVLKPGGLFFCRLASSIGMEQQIEPIAGRRFLVPDGSERYLVDEPLLTQLTEGLGGRLVDPLKTTVVQNQRSMTTWVVRKNG